MEKKTFVSIPVKKVVVEIQLEGSELVAVDEVNEFQAKARELVGQVIDGFIVIGVRTKVL